MMAVTQSFSPDLSVQSKKDAYSVIIDTNDAVTVPTMLKLSQFVSTHSVTTNTNAVTSLYLQLSDYTISPTLILFIRAKEIWKKF
jgi:hypothetical protein